MCHDCCTTHAARAFAGEGADDASAAMSGGEDAGRTQFPPALHPAANSQGSSPMSLSSLMRAFPPAPCDLCHDCDSTHAAGTFAAEGGGDDTAATDAAHVRCVQVSRAPNSRLKCPRPVLLCPRPCSKAHAQRWGCRRATSASSTQRPRLRRSGSTNAPSLAGGSRTGWGWPAASAGRSGRVPSRPATRNSRLLGSSYGSPGVRCLRF